MPTDLLPSRARPFAVVCLAALSGLAGAGTVQAAPHVPGELIVRFDSGAGADARSRALDGRGARSVAGLAAVRRVRLKPGESVAEAAAVLDRHPDVRYAEPNWRMRSFATPDDPGYADLWGLRKIAAPSAWEITTGSSSLTVAVLDTGIDFDHPDLAANIWSNPGERGSGRERNGIDDDGNGRVDDWRGWDFIEADNDAHDGNAGHGTHVAGTIGARGNDGFGVVGVASKVKLMSVRVLADDPETGTGTGDSATIAEGIGYARRNGARIVNLSLGAPGHPPQVVLDAIRAAPNVLFAVAAGNSSVDNDKTPHYPCNFSTEPNVICVAATDDADALADFSNYGVNSVQIAAPGKSILSTSPRAQVIDDFETDVPGRWTRYSLPHFSGVTVDNTWARSNESASSGAHSWTDKPFADYSTPANSGFLTSTSFSTVLIDPNDACYVSFDWMPKPGGSVYESGMHTFTVETYDPSSWPFWVPATNHLVMHAFTPSWQHFNAPIAPGHWNRPEIFLRFRFEAAYGTSRGAGVSVDDVKIWCGSPFGTPPPEHVEQNGTSMATPHVAGVAALVAAHRPTITAAGLKDVLIASAEPAGSSLTAKVADCRRLNAHRALLDPSPSAGGCAGTAVIEHQTEPEGGTATDGRTTEATPPPRPPSVATAGPARVIRRSRRRLGVDPRVVVSCPTGCELRAVLTARHRRRTVTLARSSLKIAVGEGGKPVFALSTALSRRLRSLGRTTATVTVTVKPTAGVAVTKSLKIALRPPRR